MIFSFKSIYYIDNYLNFGDVKNSQNHMWFKRNLRDI